jgi:hypothetical protein
MTLQQRTSLDIKGKKYLLRSSEALLQADRQRRNGVEGAPAGGSAGNFSSFLRVLRPSLLPPRG